MTVVKRQSSRKKSIWAFLLMPLNDKKAAIPSSKILQWQLSSITSFPLLGLN
jgi:hypothetical protein